MADKARFMCDCGADDKNDKNRLLTYQSAVTPRTRKGHFRLQKLSGVSVGSRYDVGACPPAIEAGPHARRPADERALAQVEKWMAMIREFSREQQGLSKLRA
jgi:hypothetical protein